MISTAMTVEGPTAPGVPPGTVLPAGPAGPSAFDLAVVNGYVGTEASWLASLQGPAADTRALDAATSTALSASTSAAGSAGAAASSSADAKLSSTSALTSATTAIQAKTDAQAAAQAAPGLAVAAVAPAVASATTQASAAATSASAAAGSAIAAASSATTAAVSKNWAMQASGTVDGTYYSARYYALQAAAAVASVASGPVTSVNSKTGVVTLTAADIGAAALAPSNSTAPAVDGTAAVGSSGYAARADHTHPTDTTRLGVSANFSEIATAGASAQASARGNLGIVMATASDIRAGTSATLYASPKALFDAAAFAALVDAATIAVDLSTLINAKVTLAGNRTLGNPTNPREGQSGVLRILQDATGTRTLSFGTAWDFGSTGAPTLQTGAGKEDIISYVVVDATAPRLRCAFSKGA